MSYVLLFLTSSIILIIPVAAPIFLLWLGWARPGMRLWARYLISLLTVPTVVVILLSLFGALQFSGVCGGWLGETRSCELPQYLLEQLYWTAMTLAVPTLLGAFSTGIVAGVLVVRQKGWLRTHGQSLPPRQRQD
jgi:hypothetical protein